MQLLNFILHYEDCNSLQLDCEDSECLLEAIAVIIRQNIQDKQQADLVIEKYDFSRKVVELLSIWLKETIQSHQPFMFSHFMFVLLVIHDRYEKNPDSYKILSEDDYLLLNHVIDISLPKISELHDKQQLVQAKKRKGSQVEEKVSQDVSKSRTLQVSTTSSERPLKKVLVAQPPPVLTLRISKQTETQFGNTVTYSTASVTPIVIPTDAQFKSKGSKTACATSAAIGLSHSIPLPVLQDKQKQSRSSIKAISLPLSSTYESEQYSSLPQAKVTKPATLSEQSTAPFGFVTRDSIEFESKQAITYHLPHLPAVEMTLESKGLTDLPRVEGNKQQASRIDGHPCDENRPIPQVSSLSLTPRHISEKKDSKLTPLYGNEVLESPKHYQRDDLHAFSPPVQMPNDLSLPADSRRLEQDQVKETSAQKQTVTTEMSLDLKKIHLENLESRKKRGAAECSSAEGLATNAPIAGQYSVYETGASAFPVVKEENQELGMLLDKLKLVSLEVPRLMNLMECILRNDTTCIYDKILMHADTVNFAKLFAGMRDWDWNRSTERVKDYLLGLLSDLNIVTAANQTMLQLPEEYALQEEAIEFKRVLGICENNLKTISMFKEQRDLLNFIESQQECLSLSDHIAALADELIKEVSKYFGPQDIPLCAFSFIAPILNKRILVLELQPSDVVCLAFNNDHSIGYVQFSLSDLFIQQESIMQLKSMFENTEIKLIRIGDSSPYRILADQSAN